MKTSEDGKNDMGVGVTVEFKVTERDGKIEDPAKKIWIRGWGKTISRQTDWVKWLFAFNNGQEDSIRYEDVKLDGSPGLTTDYAVVECKDAKLELKDLFEIRSGEKWIRDREIKFWVDEEKCTKKDNSVTCDLLFSPDSELKWKNEFKPRITFSN